MPMQIRKANFGDLPAILDIYRQARVFMTQQGNPDQWSRRGWPPEALVRQDIASGRSYVCQENGQILGVFYYTQGHGIEPTYHYIEDGRWIGNDTYGVVHRIASIRKGVGSFCLRWAFAQTGHLRIDTHEANIPMQRLLKKLGFQHCGTIYVGQEQSPRLAYEKCIPPAVTVVVDRPIGTRHPKHPDILYPVNYGFIPGIPSPDGEDQDAYLLGLRAPVEAFTGSVIAILWRKDDVEDKWVVSPAGTRFTAEEIAAATGFQEQYFQTEIHML